MFREARGFCSDVLLVLSGWDGLTTNQSSFLDIFYDLRQPDKTPNVAIRVYGEDPNYTPGFFDMDPDQVCAVIRHEIDPTEDGAILFGSTRRFLENLDIISDGKRGISLSTLHVCLSL